METVWVEPMTPEKAEALGTASWPIWTCPPSEFDWTYDEAEACHILEGEVEVVWPGGTARFGAGDLVLFPQGFTCRWKVAKAVRKHYRFG